MARTRIILGGIRTAESARWAVDAGADAVGFMFVRKSARYIEPDRAVEIMQALPPCISTVSVLQNPTLEMFMDIEESCPTTHTLLGGTEPDQLVRQCEPVFKTVKYNAQTITRDLAHFDGMDSVEAIVLDGLWHVSDELFDWDRLGRSISEIATPVVLAGDFTPDNVALAVRAARPFAVEVSSGVERDRGEKDATLIEAFCGAVQRADVEALA